MQAMDECVRLAPVVLLLLATALPARAARLDPNRTGRYAVGSTTLRIVDAPRARTLVTEVWYPARRAGRDAPPRAGRFPLVLMAHGFGGSRLNYTYLTSHLASWGFVVAAPSFPGVNRDEPGAPLGNPVTDLPRDLSVLREVFHDAAPPVSPSVAHVRRRAGVGLVGHSLGTFAALSAARTDAAFTAVVALAPTGQAFQPGDFVAGGPAVLVMGGTADTTTPFDTQTAYLFALLPPPSALVKILDGTHGGFAGDARGRAGQQAATQRYALAFLKRFVARDPRFGRFLTAADAQRFSPEVELTPRLR